jgi:FKBP-type peptidyl-prolyl cis-trans isomerase (trigger factor)
MIEQSFYHGKTKKSHHFEMKINVFKFLKSPFLNKELIFRISEYNKEYFKNETEGQKETQQLTEISEIVKDYFKNYHY